MPRFCFSLRVSALFALCLSVFVSPIFCRRAAAAPVIANAVVTPGSLAANGGKIAISATITDSASTLSQVSALLAFNGASYGSIALTAGAAGSYTGSYTLPQNRANAAAQWTVKIYAVSAAGRSAASSLTVPVLPDSGPALANFTATPNALAAAGGMITVSATITDAGIGIAGARILLLHNGSEYGSFNLNNGGAGDVFSGSALLPANVTAADTLWTARLVATSAMTKTTSADTTVTLRADVGPVISNLTVTPGAMAAGGGSVTVTASIADTNIGIAQTALTVLKNGAVYQNLNFPLNSSGLYSAVCVLPPYNLPGVTLWTFRVRAVSAATVAVTAPDLTLAQKGRDLSTVSGVVTLEGSAKPAQNVTMNFRATDNGVSQTRTVLLGASGGFALTDIPQGKYRLAIKGAKWLQTVQPVDTTTANVTNVTALLLAGDSNNDNSVDSSDFTALIGSFNSDATIAGSGYDPTADFNDDGHVDSGDFTLLIENYNAAGDP